MKFFSVRKSVWVMGLVMAFNINVMAGQNATEPSNPCVEPTKYESNNNFYNMGRGVVNLSTCWLEVFRCTLYRNSEVPFWGFIGGAVEGVGLTGMRAFGGVPDILFLGFDVGSIYGDQFGDFIWQSPWILNPEQDSTTE